MSDAPFDNQKTFNYLNTGLVCNSDSHWSWQVGYSDSVFMFSYFFFGLSLCFPTFSLICLYVFLLFLWFVLKFSYFFFDLSLCFLTFSLVSFHFLSLLAAWFGAGLAGTWVLHISSGNFLGSELHCCKDLCDRCTNSNDRCMGWRGRSGVRVLGACEGVLQIVHHFVVH